MKLSQNRKNIVEKVQVMIRMAPDDARALKITAAKQGRSMSAIACECIKKYMKKLVALDEDVM